MYYTKIEKLESPIMFGLCLIKDIQKKSLDQLTLLNREMHFVEYNSDKQKMVDHDRQKIKRSKLSS